MKAANALESMATLLRQGAEDLQFQALVKELAQSAELEKALALLRRAAPERTPLRRIFQQALEQHRAVLQSKRQLDPSRALWRLKFERKGGASALLPPAFLAALAGCFEAAGIELALSLERRPRPLLQVAHPLPLGTEGEGEWLDAELAREPAEGDPLPRLNAVAPEGLRFLSCESLPPFATRVAELCRGARWCWPCPPESRAEAAGRVRAFLAAERFLIEKSGKQDGQKCLKQVDVRAQVADMAVQGELLRFTLNLQQGQALHPGRLLGGIFGLDPAGLRGLVREELLLAEDPRLDQAERFQPKLRNIFEDAVLLRAESNLRIVDEDDEEPIQLG